MRPWGVALAAGWLQAGWGQIKREVREIESMEQDVARLRSEMDSLQRQLTHVQHKQAQLHSAASGEAALGMAAGASSGAGAERKQRIEALLNLKSVPGAWHLVFPLFPPSPSPCLPACGHIAPNCELQQPRCP